MENIERWRVEKVARIMRSGMDHDGSDCDLAVDQDAERALVESGYPDELRGAVRECERLREALAWYADGDHFPHPDYAARARSALRKPTGGGKP